MQYEIADCITQDAPSEESSTNVRRTPCELSQSVAAVSRKGPESKLSKRALEQILQAGQSKHPTHNIYTCPTT